ncbi:MAG: hypothetical protein WBN86_11440, partial [Porticoccaceae bacterium]
MRQTRMTPLLVLAAALAVGGTSARATEPVSPLPDPDTAHQVLAETPAVQAALAAREAAWARGEALDVGPYEF